MLSITKAIIPAAGLGRRLRPITYALPKEMFPLGRYPAIEWVSAEAVASGCREIAVVISPAKRMIETYLTSYCPRLLAQCRFTFLLQEKPLGLGHALTLAEDFCAGQPCAVLLPDDLLETRELPLIQMAKVFGQTAGAMFGITEESPEHAQRYGALKLERKTERVFSVDELFPPKTDLENGPTLRGVGRYLLTPSVLGHAARLRERVRAAELDDRVVFQSMLEMNEPVYAFWLQGARFDISTFDGYAAAWDALAGKSPYDYTDH